MKLNKNKVLACFMLLIGIGMLTSCEDTYGPMIPLPPLSNTVEGGARLLVIADQQEDKAVIINILTGERVWEWNPQKSSNPDLFNDKGLIVNPFRRVGGLEVGEKSANIYPLFID